MVFERVISTPNPPMSHEVLYIGSAVPLETSVGLEAVQQPLRARYPVDNDETIQGVLSTVVIVPEGIQLRFQGENSPPILFLFSSLSMCAAVRCVKVTDPNTGVITAKFVPLASPQAGGINSSKPAIFTAITRRTKGRQVLECHGFVTNTPKDTLDLVQWTCSMDRRSKSAGVSPTSPTGGHNYSSSTIGASGLPSPSAQRFDGDVSFRASDTSSLPDFPVQIRSSENLIGAPVGALPEHSSKEGYFYSTKNTQVKRYALQRFHGSTGVDDTPSVIGAGLDQFMRRPASAYTASQVSAPTSHHHHHLRASQQHEHLHREHREPVMYPPPPPGMIYPVGVRPGPPRPMMVPVRGKRPAMMRPVYVLPPPPPYANHRSPRFFSPPPTMPTRPVPMFFVPPGEMPATLPRPVRKGRRGSRGSSHSSSDHSSSPSPARLSSKANMNGGKKNLTQDRGASSDGSSSRPQTPPTDYEGAPKGPRVSRRDDFLLRERNGFATLPPPGAGVYMMPPYSFYPPPPGAYERARSQPPLDRKSKKKDKKSKKSSKKSGQKSYGKNGHAHPAHDMYESTDSVGGYQSEMPVGTSLRANADNRKPRDFLREENQFQHERAFSKSLAEEARKSTRGEPNMNSAYSLTDLGHRDIEPGVGDRSDGFPIQTLY